MIRSETGLQAALLTGDLEAQRAGGIHSSSAAAAAPGAAGEKWWAHELSCSSLASSDGGYTTQPWLPDEVSLHCMLCARPFHFWRWTHHCRDCGGLYCASCSSHRVEVRHATPRTAMPSAAPLTRSHTCGRPLARTGRCTSPRCGSVTRARSRRATQSTSAALHPAPAHAAHGRAASASSST